jgi:aryl-alcohol dehydrogenase-like predicted oxidoreductase
MIIEQSPILGVVSGGCNRIPLTNQTISILAGPDVYPVWNSATMMRSFDSSFSSNPACRRIMEHRQLGASGFKVPVLSLGTGTFGGQGSFKGFGETDASQATRLVDICVDAGLTMFDSADAYSAGMAEEILGQAIKGRRDKVIISTKSAFRVGPGPNDVGSSRYHLIHAVEGSLKRLKTDFIDLYQLHAFDRTTPVEETLATLDDLVKAGKIRYIGCSNFSGWHLMKSLAVSKEFGLARYVAHQAYYSLVGRDYEWELMPLALDHGVGCVAWSPLGFARLTGKIRRGQGLPATSRLHHKDTLAGGPEIADEYLFRVVDALDEIASETGKTVPQVAINWVLRRPSVANVIIGARNEAQLQQNLGAVGWQLTPDQIARLDLASDVLPAYPTWHQRLYAERNPPPV